MNHMHYSKNKKKLKKEKKIFFALAETELNMTFNILFYKLVTLMYWYGHSKAYVFSIVENLTPKKQTVL